MRIAITDDCENDREELHTLLVRYCAEQSLCAEYTFFPSAEALLESFAPGLFDLLFLDVYMQTMTGMEAARQLTQLDAHCRMIFFTTSYAYAVESYEVHAAYYLTKPLVYPRLCAAMEAACADLRQDSRCMTLHCGGIAVEVLFRDILFVDCAAERTRLHLTHRLLSVEERAATVFAELATDSRFLNCNRNVSVNMNWIERTEETDFRLKNGETVSIRQRDRSAVKKQFLQYSLHTLRKERGL